MLNGDLFGNSSLMGFRVMQNPYIGPPVQCIKVRDIKMKDGTSILSQSFRSQMDAWLLERFGKMDVAYMFNGDIFMNPKQIAMLKDYR